MSLPENTERMERLALPDERPLEPRTTFERKVYIIIFLGVLAVLTVGMAFTWMFLAATGNADNFPAALQNLTYLLVAFWIGVQVPSPLTSTK